MDSTRITVRRPRALTRSKISQLEQGKENRGRPPMKRKAVINKSQCSERTLSTLRRRQSVGEMCEGSRIHVGRKDETKIPILRPRQRGRRLNVVRKGQTICVSSNQALRNDLKIEVLNDAETEVDVARQMTKAKTMVEIKPVPASQSQDKLPLKVPTNTPTDKAPEACRISEDDMIFLMRQVNVNDFFDVPMESNSSSITPHGYQSDVLSYLKERETILATRSESTKPSVDKFHREILIDWLIDVQLHLELENETLHLAIAMMDAYQLERSISLHYLQLLGITCIFVASKYEEIFVPSMGSLCKLCADCYSERELMVMERRILRTLDYNLFFPTAVDFLTRYLVLTDINDERLVHMCNYLIDLTLSSKIPCPSPCPSLWAAAALFLALTLRKAETRHKSDDSNDLQTDLFNRASYEEETVWDWKLQTVTGYSEFYLTELAEAMTEKVRVIKDSKYQAPYRKYNIERFQYISEELVKIVLLNI